MAVDADRSPGECGAMTTTDDLVPLKVSGPQGLLAVVPTMLGFHPQESLVMLCLRGPRRRVGPVARVDLPPGRDRPLADHLAEHARRYADEVVVVSYQTARRRPPFLDELLGRLAAAGVDVMDAIVVRDGRARPALNRAMERSHPGIPVPDVDDPQVQALTAAGALAGRNVLADRDELRRSIAGPTGDRLDRAERGIDAAAAGQLPAVGPADETADTARDPDRVDAIPPNLAALVEHSLRQFTDTGRVEPEVATALAVIVNDVVIRDAMIARAVVEMDRPWLPMLIAAAGWTPDAQAPQLCAVLAVTAYRHGDGALAQVAVDRCLAAEPGHRLAHLLMAIMAAGLHPDELEMLSTPTTTAAGTGPAADAEDRSAGGG